MSRGKIVVSIISPIYNTPEKMLRNNIEHLISQTLKDIEIILVDDGSEHETADICDEYAQQDDRIVVIHQENKGLSGARNSGQRIARGDYISFVDGDDFLEYDALQNLYKETINNKVDIVFSKVVKDYGGNLKEYNYEKVDKQKYYDASGCKYLQKEILDFTANISSTGNKLYKRSFLTKNKLYHNEVLGRGAEGIEFLVRVFGKAENAIFVDKITYHYVYNDNSITEKHDEDNHDRVINCFEEIEKEAREYDNYDEIHVAILKRLQYVLVTTAISGYFSPSNKENIFAARKKYCEYIDKHPLFIESLKFNNNELDKARTIILALIKIRIFLPIKIIALLRKRQKKAL